MLAATRRWRRQRREVTHVFVFVVHGRELSQRQRPVAAEQRRQLLPPVGARALRPHAHAKVPHLLLRRQSRARAGGDVVLFLVRRGDVFVVTRVAHPWALAAVGPCGVELANAPPRPATPRGWLTTTSATTGAAPLRQRRAPAAAAARGLGPQALRCTAMRHVTASSKPCARLQQQQQQQPRRPAAHAPRSEASSHPSCSWRAPKQLQPHTQRAAAAVARRSSWRCTAAAGEGDAVAAAAPSPAPADPATAGAEEEEEPQLNGDAEADVFADTVLPDGVPAVPPPVVDLETEVGSRRCFCIVAHPDAGKTTLTEKLLLYGGATFLPPCHCAAPPRRGRERSSRAPPRRGWRRGGLPPAA